MILVIMENPLGQFFLLITGFCQLLSLKSKSYFSKSGTAENHSLELLIKMMTAFHLIAFSTR